MSTRPRIAFDEQGRCNACRWAERKQSVDWDARERALRTLLDRFRSNSGGFDCIVGVSGGKDGSYISHSLKHRFGMRPLAVSVNPPLPLALGQRNLAAFAASGYDLVRVDIEPESLRKMDRAGFVEIGFPYYGWMTAIHTILPRFAVSLGIPLVFYGEAGELEYGGSTETDEDDWYGLEYVRRIYLEGSHQQVLEASGLSEQERYW
jgi:hypothetical protein